VQDKCSADSKAQHGKKSDNLDQAFSQMQWCSEERGQRADYPDNIQPQWHLNSARNSLVAEAQLQHQSDGPDCGHDDQGDGAEEIGAIGEGDDKGQSSDQEA
jgi:hypothetical protein